MEILSWLAIRGQGGSTEAETRGDFEQLRRELRYVSRLGEEEFASFVELANTNHVIVRALSVVRGVAAL